MVIFQQVHNVNSKFMKSFGRYMPLLGLSVYKEFKHPSIPKEQMLSFRVDILRKGLFCSRKSNNRSLICSLRHSREKPGRVAQSVGHLTRKSGVLGSIPGLATYFRLSFRFVKKGSCQLLAKVCARSTG